ALLADQPWLNREFRTPSTRRAWLTANGIATVPDTTTPPGFFCADTPAQIRRARREYRRLSASAPGTKTPTSEPGVNAG
ncbi:MAG: hypothetical protein ACTJHU_02975, partial [Mycetocola sp.]